MHLILTLALIFWPWMQEVTGHYNKGPSGGGGGSTFVQACTNDDNAVTVVDLTCTFSSGTASGNGVAVYVFWAQSATPSPATGDISDSSGDTITFITNAVDASNLGTNAMYLGTTVTAGTTVLTFKCSTRTATLKCNGFEGIVAFEVHGGSRLSDGSNSKLGTGSTTANADTCTAFTTTSNNDLIVFGATDDHDNSTTFSAGTSPITFTIPTNGTSANKLANMEYGTQTTAGSTNPAFTGTTVNPYVGLCMGIK